MFNDPNVSKSEKDPLAMMQDPNMMMQQQKSMFTVMLPQMVMMGLSLLLLLRVLLRSPPPSNTHTYTLPGPLHGPRGAPAACGCRGVACQAVPDSERGAAGS